MTASANAIRIAIADDHTVVRDGLTAIIRTQPDMEIVGEAADGEQAIALFERAKPDVLVLDLRMPKLDGSEVVRRLMSTHGDARIVIMTTYDSDEDVVQSLKAGAKSYLLKDAPRQEILESIRRAHRGQSYVPPNIAGKLVTHMTAAELTQRETEVLQSLAQGLSNKEIARQLAVGEGTVKTHIKSILEKLDAISRTEAVTVGLRRGLIRL